MDPQPGSTGQRPASQAASTIVIDVYKEATSRRVPLPLPREILEAAYPNDPDIVNALCHVKLKDDAPYFGLTRPSVKVLTQGWDPTRSAVEATPRAVSSQQGGDPAPDVLLMTPVDTVPADLSIDPLDTSMTFALTASSNSLVAVPSAAESVSVDSSTDAANAGTGPESASVQPSGPENAAAIQGAPEKEEQRPAPSNNVLVDDYGHCLWLSEPTTADYAAAILRHETDKTTGTKMNLGPQAFPSTDNGAVHNPFNLGSKAAWAPYFMHGKPRSGVFRPTMTHAGSNDSNDSNSSNDSKRGQLPMPYLRFLSESATPLVLPCLGTDYAFAPDFTRVTPPEAFIQPCQGPPLTPPPTPMDLRPDWNAAGSSRQDSLSISEYALAAGTYRQWNHVGIAMHMIAGHMDRSHVESAGAGYVDLVRHLVKHVHSLGLLSLSAYPDNDPQRPLVVGLPVAMRDKKAFWSQFYHLSRFLFTEQVLRARAVRAQEDDGIRRAIPAPAVRAETPLTGHPFRKSKLTPESWWIFGRRIDTDWLAYFEHVYWKESIPGYDDLPAHPIPWSAGDDTDSDADDGNERDGERGEKKEDKDEQDGSDDDDDDHSFRYTAQPRQRDKWPNLISYRTTTEMVGCLQRLYPVLYGGSDGTPLRPDASDVFPHVQYKELLDLADSCMSNLLWQYGEGPASDIMLRKYAMEYRRTYRHPLELYSSIH